MKIRYKTQSIPWLLQSYNPQFKVGDRVKVCNIQPTEDKNGWTDRMEAAKEDILTICEVLEQCVRCKETDSAYQTISLYKV